MTTPFSAPDVASSDEVDIRDFTIKKKRVRFRIDDDVFDAYAILGLPLLQEIIKVSKTVGDMVKEQKYDAMFDLFDEILYPESAKRFRERATSKGDDAIDMRRQLLPILYFLLEEYGVRPTQPSSDSSAGSLSEIGGISSTDGSLPTQAVVSMT